VPIDTAAKRRSAAGVPFLPLGPGVTPDAAKPVAWRQQVGWGYSGIPAGAGPPPVTPSVRTFAAVGRGDKSEQAPGRGTKEHTIPGEGG
jgi:hypothetical protein